MVQSKSLVINAPTVNWLLIVSETVVVQNLESLTVKIYVPGAMLLIAVLNIFEDWYAPALTLYS